MKHFLISYILMKETNIILEEFKSIFGFKESLCVYFSIIGKVHISRASLMEKRSNLPKTI